VPERAKWFIMISKLNHPALICPYTLLEEESLAWAILIFQQALLLHPYPLPLPVSFQSPADRGLIQVRTMVRTREEIKGKDKQLKEFGDYVANNPGRGFLKYLKEAADLEEMETQEEIAGWIKGRPFTGSKRVFSIINGPILLCLIHEWMMKEWEVETSLAAIEEQEKIMVQGWQENPEEGSIGESTDPVVLKRNEAEFNCPPALAAWWDLKNTLVPEPVTLFTTQQWVWENHYDLDPEESRINSIPLPDLGSLTTANFNNQDVHRIIREKMDAVLHPAPAFDPQRAIDDFQKALWELGLPSDGKYRLVFPPYPPSFQPPPSPSSQKGSDPLILLLPTSI
jgi:hypothetical protein